GAHVGCQSPRASRTAAIGSGSSCRSPASRAMACGKSAWLGAALAGTGDRSAGSRPSSGAAFAAIGRSALVIIFNAGRSAEASPAALVVWALVRLRFAQTAPRLALASSVQSDRVQYLPARPDLRQECR